MSGLASVESTNASQAVPPTGRGFGCEDDVLLEIVHGLVSIGLRLQGTAALIDDERVARRVDDSVSDLEESIRALRTYLVDLMPPSGL